MQPFYSCKDELSVTDGCMLWGARVVIPVAGRDLVIDQLHDTHPGINWIKSLAHSYLWWAGLDAARYRLSDLPGELSQRPITSVGMAITTFGKTPH